MKKVRKKRGYWTIERSFEEAIKYDKRSDFKKHSNRAYIVLKKNGLLDKACSHMKKNCRIKVWTKDACVEAAKSCKTKSEFLRRFCGAYAISKRYGWFDELLQYFTPVGNKYNRCIYACEFPDNHVYVGLTYNMEKRKSNHLRNKDSVIYRYIKKTGLTPYFKQLTEYIPYTDAALKEGEFLEKYKVDGWVTLNKVPTGGLGGTDKKINRKWSKEKCLEITKMCNSYSELRKKYPGVLNFSKKNGFINKIREILPPKTLKNKKWTEETALEECYKYETISEFFKKSPSAYSFLLRNNLHDKMRYGKKGLINPKWTYEDAKEEALKYKTKKEFRKKANGCYQVANKRGWMNLITKHMMPSTPPKYDEKNVITILENFTNMEQLKKNKNKEIRGVYWWLKKNRKIIEYKKYLKGDPLNTKKVAWTNKLILEDIKKYATYSEYRKSGRSYQYARLHKILDIIKEYYKNGKVNF